MNKKININPSSTKWLEKDDRVVADYFCDLGFRSLKQILDMRVFDLMNMQGLNAVRVEEVIICLYKWLNPNTAIDEAIYNGMMSQPFLYTPWRKEHKDLAAIKVGDLVLPPGINMKAIQHSYGSRRGFIRYYRKPSCRYRAGVSGAWRVLLRFRHFRCPLFHGVIWHMDAACESTLF